MKISFQVLVVLFFLTIPLSALYADSDNPELDALLEYALLSAEMGNWDLALEALDDAEKLESEDPRISSYRLSIEELYALDLAQQSWVEGEPAEVETAEADITDGNEDEEDTPKFVIDRGDNDKSRDPSEFRDNLRLELSVNLFSVNPLTSETINTWSTANEFFYASLGADFRYWMPFLGRSIGFNFRSSGYSWKPGEPELLFNALDLGINLRGFLLENDISRLELGIDFGVSFLNSNDVDTGINRETVLFLGMWGSDPLLYHLFKVESLEKLVFGAGLRIYSSNSAEILETVHYRFDGAWYFKRGFSGIRFEWWDFTVASGGINMMSFSLFGGFRY